MCVCVDVDVCGGGINPAILQPPGSADYPSYVAALDHTQFNLSLFCEGIADLYTPSDPGSHILHLWYYVRTPVPDTEIEPHI